MSDREVLTRLHELLWRFPMANDAEDHSSAAEARQIRDDAVERIRALLREHPFLAETFPTLDKELDLVHRYDSYWNTLKALEKRLQE